MKSIKYMSILCFSAVLIGCGGHGYEGEYEGKAGSANELLNILAGSTGSHKIVIGSDFIESQGQRQLFDKIFIRESGSDKYLIFQKDKSEEAWKILDKNTLMQGNELANIKLVKIN